MNWIWYICTLENNGPWKSFFYRIQFVISDDDKIYLYQYFSTSIIWMSLNRFIVRLLFFNEPWYFEKQFKQWFKRLVGFQQPIFRLHVSKTISDRIASIIVLDILIARFSTAICVENIAWPNCSVLTVSLRSLISFTIVAGDTFTNDGSNL